MRGGGLMAERYMKMLMQEIDLKFGLEDEEEVRDE
jgi:hypothetical protein